MQSLRIMTQKGTASLINSFIALTLSLPFLAMWGQGLLWKASVVVLFFCYNLLTMLNRDRCIGMMLQGRYHRRLPSLSRRILHKVLYTLSFTTTLFWVAQPFDLLAFNLVCLQAPCIVATGNTVHGYLSDVE